jgi:hypothetical protein
MCGIVGYAGLVGRHRRLLVLDFSAAGAQPMTKFREHLRDRIGFAIDARRKIHLFIPDTERVKTQSIPTRETGHAPAVA